MDVRFSVNSLDIADNLDRGSVLKFLLTKSVGTASVSRRVRLVMPNDEAEYREGPF